MPAVGPSHLACVTLASRTCIAILERSLQMAAARKAAVVALGRELGSGPADRGRRLRGVWHAVVGAIGTVVGLAPHVLHHVGLLAGAGLVAGASGTVAFGLLGFIVSIPSSCDCGTASIRGGRPRLASPCSCSCSGCRRSWWVP